MPARKPRDALNSVFIAGEGCFARSNDSRQLHRFSAVGRYRFLRDSSEMAQNLAVPGLLSAQGGLKGLCGEPG